MKLMFYLDDIKISTGGAERVLTNLATCFAEEGHECFFVTYISAQNEYPMPKDVKRIVLCQNSTDAHLLKTLVIVKGIRHSVKKYSPHVLITFGVGAINRALFATIGLPVKNVISYRCAPIWEFRTLKNKLLAKTLHLRADGVVFQTEDARTFFPKVLQHRGTIIFNQVNPRFYEKEYDGERKDVVAVGRLKGMKNYKMLINAFSNIADKISDNLMIYGEGALREELQQQIDQLCLSNRVFLKGVVADVAEATKSAKLYVLCSDHEGSPNALMESMALGLPCVSTDSIGGGPRMLLGDELKNCLVPIDDAVAMSKKILEFLNDKELRDFVGQKCRKRAEMFRPEVVFVQWDRFIKKIVTDCKN